MTAARRAALARLRQWFAGRGWVPSAFQKQAWARWLDGESGLIVTPTGSGKTLAAFGGPLLDGLMQPRGSAPAAGPRPVRIVWITPLRALAADTARALAAPVAALGLPWTVALRTGDAGARDRRLVRDGRADVVVITPESLSLLLSHPETAQRFDGLRGIVVDEWHELLGSKRGVLLQLSLARLRALSPQARLWGLSATLGNLDEACAVLLPHRPGAPVVRTARQRPVTLTTLVPAPGERFPWAGHLGLSQLGRVAQLVQRAQSALVFTNTRAQAELWHRALESIWAGPPGTLALHHGSLDATLRHAAEQGLRDGSVRCVVATSSLDLGVDFPAVDVAVQIGSPKGVARLVQRAGRARHQPGRAGRIVCVPTNAWELAEFSAARRALDEGRIEPRHPPSLALDVLAQHCVTLALGGGFDAPVLCAEVRGTAAFAALSDAQWHAVLDFIVRGGAALDAYPDYRRVVRDADGRYRVHDRRTALRHRLSIGTITADGMVDVKLLRGARLGSVEEGFVSRMRPGDRFQFSGRLLELVVFEQMTAFVRLAARGARGTVPRWQGSRMALSTELGATVEQMLALPPADAEMRALAPLLALQSALSAIPAPDRLVVEQTVTRAGHHLFVHAFAGRLVHEGMAALLALRWGRMQPNTFAYAVDDHGLVVTAQVPAVLDEAGFTALLSPQRLADDLRDSMNLTEMARRQFRDVARIAGLLPPSLPGGAPRSFRQLQMSSGLIFDVLLRYDPDHVLLEQARREVFESQLEFRELDAALRRCRGRTLLMRRPATLTPLAFPLWAESQRGTLSTEDWRTRVQRAAQQLERRHPVMPR